MRFSNVLRIYNKNLNSTNNLTIKLFAFNLIFLILLLISYTIWIPSINIKLPSNLNSKDLAFQWKYPGFGRLGNQIVLLFAAHRLSMVTGWRYRLPLFKFESSSCDAVSAIDIFEFGHGPVFSLANNAQNDNSTFLSLKFVLKGDQIASSHMIFDPEDIWYYGDVFWVFGNWIDAKWISVYADNIKLTSKLEEALKPYIEMFDISNAIGIHIRGGDFKKNCAQNLKSLFNPTYWVYQCYIDDVNEIVRYVDYYQISNDQKIIIGTNLEKDHQIWSLLKEKYPDRLILLSEVNTPSEFKCMPELFDMEILKRTRTFIGNYISTYSQVITTRRHFYESYYFKRRFFHTNIGLVDGIFIALLFHLVSLLALSMKFKRRYRLILVKFILVVVLLRLFAFVPFLSFMEPVWALFAHYFLCGVFPGDLNIFAFLVWAVILVTFSCGMRYLIFENKKNNGSSFV